GGDDLPPVAERVRAVGMTEDLYDAGRYLLHVLLPNDQIGICLRMNAALAARAVGKGDRVVQADPFIGEFGLPAELVGKRVLAVLRLPKGVLDVVIDALTVGRDPLLPPALEGNETALEFDD